LLFVCYSYQSFLMVYLCKRMSLLLCCLKPIYLFCYLYTIPVEHPFQCDVLPGLYYTKIISNIQEYKEVVIWCRASQILTLVKMPFFFFCENSQLSLMCLEMFPWPGRIG
jgi:hypothetical protein